MKREKPLRKVVPFNCEKDGTSRTIKAQYYKNGFVNFFIGGDYGATGVLEANDGSERREVPINVMKDGCAYGIKANYFKNASLTTLTRGGKHFPCTGVLEIYDKADSIKHDAGRMP